MISFLLKHIPSGFWAGAVCGAVSMALIGAFAAYVLTFIARHWRGVLALCAVAAVLLFAASL